MEETCLSQHMYSPTRVVIPKVYFYNIGDLAIGRVLKASITKF